jgi:hypothetical protein
MPGLSFVSLLAYDYRFFFESLPSYYALADEIILGLDKDRLTWKKQPFNFDAQAVGAFIGRIDTQKKIRFAQGDFHSLPQPILNDTNERSQLGQLCKPENWVVQIDSDEIVQNGDEFKDWLLANDPRGYQVVGTWISVFKSFGDKVLVVDPSIEQVPVATMSRGLYRSARMTSEPGILSPLRLLHFSWGRTPQELKQKLENWSHNADFNVQAYFDLWQSVTLENYHQIRNFHPLNGPAWLSLRLATLQRSQT